MELKSMLTLNEIYKLEETPNILLYEDYKIPCICKFNNGFIKIDCKILFNEYIADKLMEVKYFKINGHDFYIADYLKTIHEENSDIWEFSLINKEQFKII